MIGVCVCGEYDTQFFDGRVDVKSDDGILRSESSTNIGVILLVISRGRKSASLKDRATRSEVLAGDMTSGHFE